MAQCAQLQPQVLLPFRLSRISEKIISPTNTASAAQIRTVGKTFAAIITANIAESPFLCVEFYFVTFTVVVSLVASLYGRKIM